MRCGMPEKLQKPVAVLMASFMISFSIIPAPIAFAEGESSSFTQGERGEFVPTKPFDPSDVEPTSADESQEQSGSAVPVDNPLSLAGEAFAPEDNDITPETLARIEVTIKVYFEQQGRSTENMKIQVFKESRVDSNDWQPAVFYGVEINLNDGSKDQEYIAIIDSSEIIVRDEQTREEVFVKAMHETALPYETVRSIAATNGISTWDILKIGEPAAIDVPFVGNSKGLVADVYFERPANIWLWGGFNRNIEHVVSVLHGDTFHLTNTGEILFECVGNIQATDPVNALAVIAIHDALKQVQDIRYPDMVKISFVPVNDFSCEGSGCPIWRGNIAIHLKSGEAIEGTLARIFTGDDREEYKVSFSREDRIQIQMRKAVVRDLVSLFGLPEDRVTQMIESMFFEGEKVILKLSPSFMAEYTRLLGALNGAGEAPSKMVYTMKEVGGPDILPGEPNYIIAGTQMFWADGVRRAEASYLDGRLYLIAWYVGANTSVPSFVDEFAWTVQEEKGVFNQIIRHFDASISGDHVLVTPNAERWVISLAGDNRIDHVVEHSGRWEGMPNPEWVPSSIRTDFNYEWMMTACWAFAGSSCPPPAAFLTSLQRTDEAGNVTSDIELNHWAWDAFGPIKMAVVNFPDGSSEHVFYENLGDLLLKVRELEQRAFTPLAKAALNYLSQALDIDAEELKGLVDIEVDEENNVYFTFRDITRSTGNGQVVGALLFNHVPKSAKYTMSLEGGVYVPEKASFTWDGKYVSDVVYAKGLPANVTTFRNGTPINHDIITYDIPKGGNGGRNINISRYFTVNTVNGTWGVEDPSALPRWVFRMADNKINQVTVFDKAGTVTPIDFEYIAATFNCVMEPCDNEGTIFTLNALVIHGKNSDLVRAKRHDGNQFDITILGWNGAITVRPLNLEELINVMISHLPRGEQGFPTLSQAIANYHGVDPSAIYSIDIDTANGVEVYQLETPEGMRYLKAFFEVKNDRWLVNDAQKLDFEEGLKAALVVTLRESKYPDLGWGDVLIDQIIPIKNIVKNGDPRGDAYEIRASLFPCPEGSICKAHSIFVTATGYYNPTHNTFAIELKKDDPAKIAEYREKLLKLIDSKLAEAKEDNAKMIEIMAGLEQAIEQMIRSHQEVFEAETVNLDSVIAKLLELISEFPSENPAVFEILQFVGLLPEKMDEIINGWFQDFKNFIRTSVRVMTSIKAQEAMQTFEKYQAFHDEVISAAALEDLERMLAEADHRLEPVSLPRPGMVDVLNPTEDLRALTAFADELLARYTEEFARTRARLAELDQEILRTEDEIGNFIASLPSLIESIQAGYLAQHEDMSRFEEQLINIRAFLNDASGKVSDETEEQITTYLTEMIIPNLDELSRVAESLLSADPTEDPQYRDVEMRIQFELEQLERRQLMRDQVLLGMKVDFPEPVDFPRIIVDSWWDLNRSFYKDLSVRGDALVEFARKEMNIAVKISQSTEAFNENKVQIDDLRTQLNGLLAGLPERDLLVTEVRNFLNSLDAKVESLTEERSAYHDFIRSSTQDGETPPADPAIEMKAIIKTAEGYLTQLDSIVNQEPQATVNLGKRASSSFVSSLPTGSTDTDNFGNETSSKKRKKRPFLWV